MLLLLLGFISTVFTQAAFVVHGLWDTKLAHYKNINLNDTQPSEKNYIAQKFYLSPEILINDNLSINSQWYFLGALGQNDIQITYNNNDNSFIYGTSTYAISIIPTELYLNWKTDYFTFKAGRQSFNFGLGVFKNANEYTDIVDRIVFNFPFDTVYIKFAIDTLQNKDITNSSDLYQALMFEAGYTNDIENIEMAFLLYKEYQQYITTTYDLYANKKFPLISLDVQLEVAYRDGNGLNSFAFAIDTNWINNNVTLNLKTGLATGDSSETVTERTFVFSPSYEIAMLLFRQDLGIGANVIYNRNGIGNSYDGLGAFYLAPSLKYTWTKFDFIGSFIYARTQKTPNTHSSSELGYEFDLTINYNVYSNFMNYLKLGILKPGEYFSANNIAYGIMLGMETRF